MYICALGYQPTLKNTSPPSFLPTPSRLRKLSKPPSPLPIPFSQFVPLYFGFLQSSLKSNFSVNPQTPIILKFFILNFISSFKSLKITKFLVIISQFKFLNVTEKNIFAYELFLSLNISDFSLFFM